MASMTPTEFGEAVGLTKGIDALPSDVYTVEEAPPLYDVMLYLASISPIQSGPFFYELAASYLPSILRTFFHLPLDPYKMDNRYLAYQQMSVQVVQTPAFIRFARDHPEDNCSLALMLVKLIANVPDSAWSEITYTSLLLGRLLTHLELVWFQSLKAGLPQASTVPAVDAVTRAKIVRLLPLLVANRIGKPQQHQTLQGLSQNGIDVVASRNGLVRRGEMKIEFDVCELKNGDGRDGAARCVKSAKEMDACSRCLNVRYCSHEHQKLDWKRHKASCFKSSW